MLKIRFLNSASLPRGSGLFKDLLCEGNGAVCTQWSVAIRWAIMTWFSEC